MSKSNERIVLFVPRDMLPSRTPSFSELVKVHIAETGMSERWARVAVALTPEGKAAWEKERHKSGSLAAE
jgi:hypothetical protein